jgi:hypothetical protein
VWRATAVLAVTLALAGCGGGGAGGRAERDERRSPAAPRVGAGARSEPPQAPGVGAGPRFRPPSLGARAARAEPVSGLRCARADRRRRFGAHLELFAAGKVVLVAPGIGIAPPRERRGAYVGDGRCEYPLRTREPTGVIEVEHGTHPTLGDLFAVWGQPLSERRMAGFRGTVRAYVGGRRRPGNPRSIRLARHSQIVLEVGEHVPPHSRYLFPPGL